MQNIIFIKNNHLSLIMVKGIRDIKACPECGGINLIHKEEENQVICKDCGLIYEPYLNKKGKKSSKK